MALSSVGVSIMAVALSQYLRDCGVAMTMKLYDYFRSTAAYRVRIALNMKGQAYEQIFINLKTGEQKNEGFARINPQRRLPVLEVDGMMIGQSGAILDYIEETWPEPRLLPRDRLIRARVRHLSQIIACDIHPLNNIGVLAYLKNDLALDEAAVSRWYAHWIEINFVALEAEVGAVATPFAFGNAPSLFELHLVPQIYNARRFSVDLSAYPRLVAIDAACLELPAFDKARPERQEDCPPELRETSL